jgi:segregation and condensation protein A
VDLPKDFESSLEAYPIDLLIHLIKTSEVNVYDIPIALITNQYLEYIELMQEMNLDIAGEFLVMAATLIHIKSRMLLPRPPSPGIRPRYRGSPPASARCTRGTDW